jgi:hypothetical protein
MLWFQPAALWLIGRELLFLFFFKFIHLFTCAYIGSFYSSASIPHALALFPHQFQAGPLLSLSIILLKRRHKHN